MSETSSGELGFAEFRAAIAEELQVDEERVVPEASFVDDLYADSLQLLRLMLRLEELGITIPLEAAWQIQTVGDAYQLYRESRAGGPAPAQSEAAQA
jgi:acyl carrier protein